MNRADYHILTSPEIQSLRHSLTKVSPVQGNLCIHFESALFSNSTDTLITKESGTGRNHYDEDRFRFVEYQSVALDQRAHRCQ
jgi:hypothetical protein